MALSASSHAQPSGATGVLVLGDGTVIWGKGFGATGNAVGEVCFNTAMTGYQEVMTDPSYDSQIVTFTFPHIGNVGANEEDHESRGLGAVGCVVRQEVTPHSNFRAQNEFVEWMKDHGKIGLSGVDTRALTRRIRMAGAPNAVIAHSPRGEFDLPALKAQAAEWSGLEGLDLVPGVTRDANEDWTGGHWQLGFGYGEGKATKPHVVAIDYGAKDNIFRNLVQAGAKVTVVPARATLDEVLALQPDGVFLSNGPGDPAATGEYAVPVIKGLLERDVPLFGICLGHQMLGLAAGAKTAKMFQGHRGANHPVQRVGEGWGDSTGLVEITSMNHGFAVDGETLPEGVEQTHVSLFDGTNCGISIKGKKAFGVQYHPEASPGPQDSFYLFEKFVGML
ncbi:glutamine-hydrolyzing carbamoyl-phosphate synthase small subunit [Qipengyuania flava]|uniref:glutamine-hydrolyzing carbamoyl-phosphate synthase small subunit n=1 Tax=Qipengyuania flava TaxID=192812 RepID=UPI001C57D7DB|nr:glutamine-hydrolyzing carbamoyl-phosphate synthase small subunit [Qipengyuania flava]MBW3168314.1 glutamine-hydrolyzing carbamoyl-phosphate synthase small subunit [Qipengyuania flava]MBY5965552.1 glutamine-hydrolyzing carbamoyl-phosphate synthase small subunit [Qipengyuania flava]MBY6011876.1 glutamine-hydrolyzing carbamoyl-phosphate synthase small subunit [Qipengyuania flava]MBY6026318.1 glutamine-hydrolyzing carbamoyl-phosphate synthase small subunit [Qipengyuania flava]